MMFEKSSADELFGRKNVCLMDAVKEQPAKKDENKPAAEDTKPQPAAPQEKQVPQ